MFLTQIKVGQKVKIKKIPNERVRSQAIRLGIGEESIVWCYEIIPRGPIIIKRNRQEIAIGRRLAETITVEEIDLEE